MSDQQKEAPSDAVAVEFGDYRIHELIGTGGMAEVYRASRREAAPDKGGDGAKDDDEAVVIKRVKPQHAGDPGFVQMFVDEAKLSAQLKHPNIVKVFEYGEHDSHHFIAMEYLDGLHLQGLHVRYAQRHKRSLPWRAGLIIVRDVLRGLDYAHSKKDDTGRPMGLIHRDINLVNVMVGRSGDVKLLDFGIVKAADGIRSAETVGGVLKGKFGYMSPEQAEGKTLDNRSDVFAASIVLHELLTGRRLFWGKDDLEILRRVRTGDVPDPRQFAPDVPEDLVAVVNKGLERDVDKRYQSAGAMADALDEVIEKNHVLGSVLKDLMRDLLEEKRSEATDKMSARRRKMTLLAWQQGVKEQEAPRRRRSVAGTLGGEDTKDTSAGSKAAGKKPGPAVTDTVITTDIKWMSAGDEGDLEPVISEQAQAALEAAGEADLADELADELADVEDEGEGEGASRVPSLALLAAETQILDEDSDLAGLASSEEKTQILDEDSDLAGLASAEEKTQILDEDSDLAGLASAEEKTQILDEDSDAAALVEKSDDDEKSDDKKDDGDEEEPEGAREDEKSPGLEEGGGATGITKPQPDDARKKRIRILLAVTAVAAVAVILLLIFNSR